MNFRPRPKNKPELNLIPLIDVLIVLLIFLVLTTTFSREAALRIRLPEASAEADPNDKGLDLLIDAQGHYSVNGRKLINTQMVTLKQALREAAGDKKDPLVTISADRAVQHHVVYSALGAAQELGFVHISFIHNTPER
ncbi:MAG: ExbD/TolR family protein [Candidatus Methylumidiphilus sp.]